MNTFQHALTEAAGTLLSTGEGLGRLVETEVSPPAAFPRGRSACEATLERAVRDAIAVLRQTKDGFRSKTLGALRQRIEETLTDPEAAQPGESRHGPIRKRTGASKDAEPGKEVR